MIDYFKLNLFETIQQTEASLRFGIIQTTNRNLPCINNIIIINFNSTRALKTNFRKKLVNLLKTKLCTNTTANTQFVTIADD